MLSFYTNMTHLINLSIYKWQFTEDADVPDVFLLVFLRYLDVPSVWFQLVGGNLAQDLLVNGEEHLQPTLFYVIIPAGQTDTIIISVV